MATPSQEFCALRDVNVMGLAWQRQKDDETKNEFELRVGAGNLVAKFWKVGAKCPSAVAETVDGRWKMERREGLFAHTITIRPDGSDLVSATFTFIGIWGKGKLRFADGRRFTWRRRTVTGDKWAFFDKEDRMVIEFQQRARSLWSECAGVGAAKEAVDMPEASMLILLGYYLILILAINEHKDDQAH